MRRQSSYNVSMNVATSTSSVGIRELKNDLSRYIDRVRNGEDVIVTDRGRPVARLSPLGRSADRLAELVDAGIVQPPVITTRRRPPRRIQAAGTASDLVADQRR